MRSTRSLCTLALLILLAFPRLVYEPSGLLAGNASDLAKLWLPLHTRVAQAIQQTGKLPTWDRAGFGGRPLVANPQAGIWYPPVWLFWWSRTPAVFSWLTAGHLAFAAWGASRMARASGCDKLSATLAGAVFAINPYMIAQIFDGHDPQLWGAAYYPWIFLCAVWWRRGNGGSLALLPIPLALSYLTGHPQPAFFATIALAAWACTAILAGSLRQHSRDALRFGCGLVLACLATAGLLAFAWLPVVSAQPWTLRASRVALHETQTYSLTIAGLLGQAAPAGEVALPFVITTCALVALALPNALRVPAGRGWTCLLAASVAAAAGRYMGLYAILYQIIPGIDRFRVPSRALFLSAMAIAMLTAYAMSALARWPRLRACVAALLLAELLGSAWCRVDVKGGNVTEAGGVEQQIASYCHSHDCRVVYQDGALGEVELARRGVESTDLYDWFQLQHAADLYETLYGIDGPDRWVDAIDPLGAWHRNRRQQAVLDRMSVGLVVRQGVGGEARLRENSSAMPRAYVVGRAACVPDDTHMLEWLTWVNPRLAVVMSSDPLTGELSSHRQSFTVTDFHVIDGDTIEINVATEAPGLLVMTDTWMPGWHATDNGDKVPILRGNGAQRVIALRRPGPHRIVMWYEAPGLRVGAMASVFAAAGWLAYARWLAVTPNRVACGATIRR